MRTYLALKERAASFRADPRVAAAIKDSRIDELATPTLAAGESWKDLTTVNVDVDALAARGYQYETIDQLAIEHLMGMSLEP